MTDSPLKHPSALAPLAMSLAALSLVLVHALRFGIVHEADEGTEAPRPALLVLALQAAAVVAAFTAVYFLT